MHPQELAPRIGPGTRGEVGLFNWAICRALGKASGTDAPNLFTTLGRQKGLFRGWLYFAGKLMPGGKLSRRESELVILRVAHLRGCEYEWRHHVRLGRKAGVAGHEIDLLQGGGFDSTQGWRGRDLAILGAVDELSANQNLDDETWDNLRLHLNEPETIELLLLVGHYQMLATTILTLRIEPDVHKDN